MSNVKVAVLWPSMVWPTLMDFHFSSRRYRRRVAPLSVRRYGLAASNTVDQKAVATGSGSTFDSGGTTATTTANELILGVAGIQGGDPRAWGGGFIALPTLTVSQDQLVTAYEVVSATGSYHATGSAQKTWMAGVVALK